MTRNNSIKIKLFIACCFIHQANYRIDANKNVHCIYCLFVHDVHLRTQLKCVHRFIVFQCTLVYSAVEVVKTKKTRNRE